jgi:hypothetical protein
MNIWSILLTAAVAAVKVIPAVGVGVGAGLSAIENYIVIMVGGMLAIAVYAFFGKRLNAWNKHRRQQKPDYGAKVQQNFRKARRIMRIWHRFGLYGIALLTPPLLSPPIGTLIAVAFHETMPRILLFMGISMAAWIGLMVFAGDFILSLF